MKKLSVIVCVLLTLLCSTVCSAGTVSEDFVEAASAEARSANGNHGYQRAYPFGYDNEEYTLKGDMVRRMDADPTFLASYLHTLGELDQFVDVVGDHPQTIVINAGRFFIEHQDVHQEAFERAFQLLGMMHIDSKYEEPVLATSLQTSFDEFKAAYEWLHPQIPPLATIAETGEPISSEPNGPWNGPSD